MPEPSSGRPTLAEAIVMAEVALARNTPNVEIKSDTPAQGSGKPPAVGSGMFWRYVFVYIGSAALLAHALGGL